MKENAVKVIATNRKAYHDYEVIETLEAGMVLTGIEIKSIRAGKVNLTDGFVLIRDGEAWLLNVHIAPYSHGARDNHEPKRERKLLLHRFEINRLATKVAERGWTIVPLRLYLRNNRAKVEIGLVRGKRLYDKRATIARRDAERELERALKEYR
ncbi:MAG: SsrA-binding protein SmpB [Anaerolineae bacterium]|nr:SsrA-binding protein SmpB [Caldilineales bacterium]MDW8268053.1 SsrA-binding protein SmpB [Anaerolineae bacterium]